METIHNSALGFARLFFLPPLHRAWRQFLPSPVHHHIFPVRLPGAAFALEYGTAVLEYEEMDQKTVLPTRLTRRWLDESRQRCIKTMLIHILYNIIEGERTSSNRA